MINKITNKTTNHSDRDIDKQFDFKQFNKQFEDQNKILEDEEKQDQLNNINEPDEIIDTNLPHNKSIEEIIINIRELFYKLIDMMINMKNPIPFITSSSDRFFSFTILLLIVGILLLLFSNLFI